MQALKTKICLTAISCIHKYYFSQMCRCYLEMSVLLCNIYIY